MYVYHELHYSFLLADVSVCILLFYIFPRDKLEQEAVILVIFTLDKKLRMP